MSRFFNEVISEFDNKNPENELVEDRQNNLKDVTLSRNDLSPTVIEAFERRLYGELSAGSIYRITIPNNDKNSNEEPIKQPFLCISDKSTRRIVVCPIIFRNLASVLILGKDDISLGCIKELDDWKIAIINTDYIQNIDYEVFKGLISEEDLCPITILENKLLSRIHKKISKLWINQNTCQQFN